LGEFNQKGSKPTKYGTKDELKEMIKVARNNGIVTYVDAVLNHKFGADICEKFEVSDPFRTDNPASSYHPGYRSRL
jgi:alpha-amylase